MINHWTKCARMGSIYYRFSLCKKSTKVSPATPTISKNKKIWIYLLMSINKLGRSSTWYSRKLPWFNRSRIPRILTCSSNYYWPTSNQAMSTSNICYWTHSRRTIMRIWAICIGFKLAIIIIRIRSICRIVKIIIINTIIVIGINTSIFRKRNLISHWMPLFWVFTVFCLCLNRPTMN